MEKVVMKMATCDFETTTDPEDCRVWAVGFCDIDNLDFTYGNSISFFFLKKLLIIKEFIFTI